MKKIILKKLTNQDRATLFINPKEMKITKRLISDKTRITLVLNDRDKKVGVDYSFKLSETVTFKACHDNGYKLFKYVGQNRFQIDEDRHRQANTKADFVNLIYHYLIN